MLEYCSRKSGLGLGLLLLSALALTWVQLGEVNAQQSNCRTPADRARFVEVRAKIDALKQQVGAKQPVPPAVQKELDGLQKELVSIMMRRPCSMGAGPVKGPGTPPPAKDEDGMRVEDCQVINCDCDNVSAGILTGAWRRECRTTEADLKQQCAARHYIDRMCHATASGPAAFPMSK